MAISWTLISLSLLVLASSDVISTLGGTSVELPTPIRFGYVLSVMDQSTPSHFAAGMGVPGYAPQTIYNYMALAFWTTNGNIGMAAKWANPVPVLSPQFGTTKNQIQKRIKKKFNDAGIKLLISAFGSTDLPTTNGKNPNQEARKLANFVKNNNLDGVDVDFVDNNGMNVGLAEAWLIEFTRTLRTKLGSDYIITHSPQAPYFKEEHYTQGGGYMKIHDAVGDLIDFYNVMFYNQGSTSYDTYRGLFKQSIGWASGTSVKEIIDRGIPSEKLVLGKPATAADVYNTGLVDSNQLGNWIVKANNQFGWSTGVMFWQYRNDNDGKIVANSFRRMIETDQCIPN